MIRKKLFKGSEFTKSVTMYSRREGRKFNIYDDEWQRERERVG